LAKDGTVVTEDEVDARLLHKNDILKVVPGTRIPADGVVVRGTGMVDESMVTGESMPVSKVEGSEVVAGTINQTGSLLIRATRVGSDNTISQIISLVQNAQTSKAPIQRHADMISARFVPFVLLAAFLTWLFWYLMAAFRVVPHSWYEADGEVLFSLMFGLSVVIIACPCALGLATPTAVMVGTGIAAANGILIKGGEALENAHRVRTILFDKTGTITHGKPAVTKVLFCTSTTMPLNQTLWRLVGAAETNSEHPLGRALVNRATEELTGAQFPVATDFQAVVGKGVSCVIEDQNVSIGNHALMEEQQIVVDEQMVNGVQALEVDGNTVVYVAINKTMVAAIGIADTVKQEAKAAIEALQKLGVQTWMVTGDNRRTAHAIARQVCIPPSQVMAEVLPGNKAAKVKEMQSGGRCVAMVGDGINDSPALAQADLGIAIGAGTDIAIEAADVVLIRSDLRDVYTTIHLSRVCFNRIRLNLLFSLGYNTIGIPIAMGVLYPWFHVRLPPEAAALAMALSSVSVVLSSLLLRRYKKPIIHST